MRTRLSPLLLPPRQIMSPQLLFAFTTVEGKMLAWELELSLDLVPSSITCATCCKWIKGPPKLSTSQPLGLVTMLPYTARRTLQM